MKINYGLMAVSKEMDSDGNRNVYHFCGYTNRPTAEDRIAFAAELKSDEKFLIDEEYVIVDAPKEIIPFYREMVAEYEKTLKENEESE